VLALVEKIGKAEGIGAVLSKGFEEAVRVFGKQTAPYVMAVRGEGLPAHDPRWHASLALTYFYDPTRTALPGLAGLPAGRVYRRGHPPPAHLGWRNNTTRTPTSAMP
jgi:aldehyde:ferredoxin oxidoreductase